MNFLRKFWFAGFLSAMLLGIGGAQAGQIGILALPAAWTNLGSGLNGMVNALAVASNGTLYAGGDFTTAGGVTVNHIAQWNGSSWSALGSGMNAGSTVNALLITNGILFAGGNYSTVDGVSATNIAQWNGSSWSALGSGMAYPGGSHSVDTLAMGTNGVLYAGGNFTQASGVTAKYIAQWNGSSWSALGYGVNGETLAMVVGTNGILYAGNFSKYYTDNVGGGVSVNYVAQWNGSSWSALGSGVGNIASVKALAITTNGTLYAGGQFSIAGGASFNAIAQWNGSGWSGLGSGMDRIVSSLAVAPNGILYAGGNFANAGGVSATNIAQWNGSSWSALGSGMNLIVTALAVSSNGNLYAGGSFSIAGGVTANNIAQWSSSQVACTGVSPSSGSTLGGYNVTITGTGLGNGSDITNVTLCGRSVSSIVSQTATQVVVVANVGSSGLGNVAVYSTSCGMSLASNAFTYTTPQVASNKVLLVAPQANNTWNYGGSDCVQVPDSIDFRIPTFTIESWVCRTSTNSAAVMPCEYIFSKGRDVITGSILFCRENGSGGTNYIVFGVQGAGLLNAVDYSQAGQWYHVAGAYDAINGTISIYINGNLCAFTNLSGLFAPTATTPPRIGMHCATDICSYGWHGYLDEVRFWNYARSQTQIQSAMSGGITGSVNGLVANWTFDNGTAADTTGHGHNGTLNGGAVITNLVVPFIQPYIFTSDGSNITITGYAGSGGAFIIPSSINGLPVTSIGCYGFSGYSSSTNLIVPACVSNIGNYAFFNCPNLTNIYFYGNAPSLGSNVFFGDKALTVYYLPGTTGWGTFGFSPTVLWNPHVKNDATFGIHTNCFGFTFTNAGSPTIVIEACTNLTNPVWIPVSTSTLTTGSSYFSDPSWTNYPSRFYRFRSP